METNKIYNEDCLKGMKKLPENSIDLIVTSPPYLNLREYSYWDSYEKYLNDVDMWFQEMSRILKNGGYLAWNVQENIPNPTDKAREYYPLLADSIKIGNSKNLIWENNIVWNKKNSTQNYFGSYPYPQTPIFWNMTEPICIFRKPGKRDMDMKEKKKCKLDKERWYEIVRGYWEIPAAKASKIGHSAPFPEEIPKRFIEITTTYSSIVLDPFMGSGTTAIACEKLNRNFIGFEKSQEYYYLSLKRLGKINKKYYKQLPEEERPAQMQMF